MSLVKVRPGGNLVIDRVPEDDQALLEYLVANDLVPGRAVTVKEVAPSRGVITLLRDENELVFSYDVAAKIRVCPEE